MKKTLYISDLDGTLLDKRGELSPYTKKTLTRLIEKGVLFTVATARSHQATKEIAQELSLQLPAVLTNGVTIYDYTQNRYLQTTPLPREHLAELTDLFEQFNVSGFLYTLEQDTIHVFHTRLTSPIAVAYRDERKVRFKGRMYECMNLAKSTQNYTPLYFVVYASRDALEALSEAFSHIPELTGALYENVYDPGWYFMDIFSSKASKATGMKKIMELCGAQEVVAFGDNYNDLPMLKEADRAYVPANAVDEAKAIANGTLDYHHKDSVAQFIEQEASL